jgi:hypothetical protein
VKVTPEGSAPVSDNAGAGAPLAVTVNVLAVLAANVGSAELVIAGAPLTTVRVRTWDVGPVPLTAERSTVYVPTSDVAAVPAMVAVPLPLSVRVIPAGSPLPPIDGAGYPAVVTVKLNGLPVVAVAVDALVIAGAEPTTTVTGSVASGLIPLAAVTSKVTVPVAVGVPYSRAVPPALTVNDKPAGSVTAVAVIAGVGNPAVLMANEPIWPSVKSAVAFPVAVLMVGAVAGSTVTARLNVDKLSSAALVAVTEIAY